MCIRDSVNTYHFWHKPSDFKIYWYKYALRGAKCNMDITDEQFIDVLYDCLNSLEEGKTFLTATIDVPDLEQSYQIFYEYYGGEIEWEPDLHEFLVISCLYDSDRIIYPDFDCKDRYGQEMYNSIVARYINQFSFDQFSAFVKDNDFSTVQINPIKENPTPEEKESYIKETKAAVESLGVPAETLQYYVLQPNDYTYMLSQ